MFVRQNPLRTIIGILWLIQGIPPARNNSYCARINMKFVLVATKEGAGSLAARGLGRPFRRFSPETP
jgi:hypothetical protein